MLVIKRKNIIVGLLVVLLIITGYLNFVYNQSSAPAVNPQGDVSKAEEKGKAGDEADQDTVTDSNITISDMDEPGQNMEAGENSAETVVSTSSTFFRDYRFEREQDRNKEISIINSIIENPKSDAEMIKEAQAQLLEITSSMEAELAIENLIKAKGINDAIVIIHKDNVNVIVDKPELVPEEVAMILDIVKRESGKETENIKIIPKI